MYKKFLFSLAIALAAVFAFGVGQSNAEMYVPPGHIGDLLLGTVYDVRVTPERLTLGENWENFIEIQNTTNKWVAAHLRFRGYKKSLEVWDHIILLSPYDVLWLYIVKKADTGGVTIASEDYVTLANSGLISKADAAAKKGYKADFSTELMVLNGFADDQTELEYGEWEVIGLWSIDNDAHNLSSFQGDSYNDPADSGAINVYDILYTQWGGIGGPVNGNPAPERPANYGGNGPLLTLPYVLDDCGNVLKASMEMGDIITGQWAAYPVVAVENFRTDDLRYFHRDQYTGGAILFPVQVTLIGTPRCYLPVGSADKAWYLNPDVATTVGPTLKDGDSETSDGVDFNAPWSLDDIELALWKDDVWGFYMDGDTFENSFLLYTDVNITFPTKYLHYFNAIPYWPNLYAFCDQYIIAVDGFKNAAGVYSGGYRNGRKAAWDAKYNGPIFVDGWIFDVDQNRKGYSPGPSPSPFASPWVPHEVNIMRIGDPGTIFTDAYTMGHFFLNRWWLLNGEIAGDGGYNQLPMLGLVVRLHSVGGLSVWRSTAVPVQYKAFDVSTHGPVTSQ